VSTIPHFDIVAAIPLMIFSIASMAEATGQTVVNAEIVGKEIDVRRSATRTIRGDGLTSLVGGLFGTPLMVTSGGNIGIVRISGVRSRFVTLTAGVILVVIGVVAPIGRVISLAAVAPGVGLLPILIPGFYDKFPGDVRILLGSGVAMGAFVAALLNIVFHHLGAPRPDARTADIAEIRHDEHHRGHDTAAPPDDRAAPREAPGPTSEGTSHPAGVAPRVDADPGR
jgi:xanthine/uracil permease